MVDFRHIDCTRFRKPGWNFSEVEEQVIKALAEGMKSGTSPETVLAQLIERGEFKEYASDLTEYYEKLTADAEQKIKREALEEKKHAEARSKEQQRKLTEEEKSNLRLAEQRARDEAKARIEKEKGLSAKVQETARSVTNAGDGLNKTLEEFLKRIENAVETPTDTLAAAKKTSNLNSLAHETIADFYNTLTHKEARQARRTPWVGHALAKEAEQFSKKHGKRLDEILENPLLHDQLFRKLSEARPRYCNIVPQLPKEFGERLDEAVQNLYDGAVDALNTAIRFAKRMFLPVVITGAVAGVVYLGVREYQREQANERAEQIEFVQHLVNEDRGRIAYLDLQGALHIFGRSTEKITQDSNAPYASRTTKHPDTGIGALAWSSNGLTLFYTVPVSMMTDATRIRMYDPANEKSTDILTLEKSGTSDIEKYFPSNLGNIDSPTGKIIRIQTLEGRLYFSITTGSYSVNEDGTGLKTEQKVLGRDQLSCPSGNHHLELISSNAGTEIFITNGTRKVSLGFGTNPVYTEVDDR